MEQENTFSDIASEPIVVRPTTSYADIMGYLHRIRITPEVKESVGRRLLAEVNEPYLAKTFSRLDHLSELKENWDGYGAEQISYSVLENLREVLLISENDDWRYWMISPAPNGTLSLQSKHHTASLSVGDDEFSYYSVKNDKEDWADHVKFTPSSFLKIMRRIV